jgi:hypothetical protein
MLIQELRMFQVVTFRTLGLLLRETRSEPSALDAMVVADEVDAQLMESVRNLMGTALFMGAD